jgi:MFS transporter, DHA2 family, multidrug resistance protein
MVENAAAIAAARPNPPLEDGLPPRRRRIATAAILSALVLVVLDGVIANLALPTIAQTLNVSAAASVWVVTGYQLALVMFLLPGAAIGESLGYRRVFAAGVTVFTLASGLCALAPSLEWLVAARFVQGLGGAAIMSLGAGLLRLTHPLSRLGVAIGWNALTVALTSAAGPSVGATILSQASWPWLFAVNIPVGAVVLAMAAGLPSARGSGRRVDLASVGLNALAFGTFVIGADLTGTDPGRGAALIAIAAAAFTVLIRRERARTAPLIPLDLLRAHPFRISVIASVCCFAGQMAAYVALPFYIQHGLGRDAFTTGLLMTPWPLTVALAAPLSGRLSDRVPTAWLCAIGGGVLAAGLVLAALWPLHDTPLPLIAFTILGGLGFGFFQTPNNRTMLLSAPRERSGAAGGMQSSARVAGQTLGAVIVALLLTLTPADLAPRIALGIAAVLALAGGLVSTLRRPAKTG